MAQKCEQDWEATRPLNWDEDKKIQQPTKGDEDSTGATDGRSKEVGDVGQRCQRRKAKYEGQI